MNKNNMTPVRACQVATKLLRELDADPLCTKPLSREERDAIEALRNLATRVATGFVAAERKSLHAAIDAESK